MTARVISVPCNHARARAVEEALGGDKLVAYLGVDPRDEHHYYVAVSKDAAPLASILADMLARALNEEARL